MLVGAMDVSSNDLEESRNWNALTRAAISVFACCRRGVDG